MKRIIILAILTVSLQTTRAYIINDLHFACGDSAHYLVNRNEVQDLDLNNVYGSRIWDMRIPFGSEKLETMMICEVGEGYFGSQFPHAEWVAINLDHEAADAAEAYMGRIENAVVAYGYGEDIPLSPKLAIYDNQKGDSLYVFPMVLGTEWTNVNEASFGDTSIITTVTKRIVNHGKVLTEVGTFTCVVMRTQLHAAFTFMGHTVATTRYIQYDWLVDTLASVASIRSLNGEANERFTTAGRTQRIIGLWSSDEEEPGVIETDEEDFLLLDVNPIGHDIKIHYTLKQAESVVIVCYDATGRVAAKKVTRSGPGKHEITFTTLQTGVYFVEVQNKKGSATTRCVVLD